MKLDRPLLVVDVETTGCDEDLHDVCELGAVLLDEHLRELDSFASYIKPISEYRDPKAMAVHCISEKTLLVAPTFTDVMGCLGEMVLRQKDCAPLLTGWGVDFDWRFLRAGCKKACLPWPFGHRTLDVRCILVWELACRGVEYKPELGSGLSIGMEKVGLKFQGAAHGAFADAKNTAELLRHLADQRTP